MSNLEKDLNPDTFIGISLPLDYGSNGFFNQTRTTLQQVRHNIKNLLLTIKGERLGNPTFGSELMRVVFEPDDSDIAAKVEEAIRSAISEWMSFVQVDEVNVTSDPYNQNQINVSIKFKLNMDNNVQTINLNLGPDAPFNQYEVSDAETGEFETDYT